MGKRKRPPFDQTHKIKRKVGEDKNGKSKYEVEERGGAPKKISRGLRRHLAKVRRQNPQEADRQEAMIRG